MANSFKQVEHDFVRAVTGIDPGDYELEAVLARYKSVIPIVCSCLGDSPHSDKGVKLKDTLRNALELNLRTRSSKVIDDWIDIARHGDPEGIRSAKKLIDFAHDTFIEYNRTESATNRGPDLSQTLYQTAHITHDQFVGYARRAQAKVDEIKVHHTNLYAITVACWDTYKDFSVFKDCYDLYKDVNLFLKSLSAQESVAAASTVLSPVGPGAVALVMAGELLTLHLMFLNVVTELIDFFAKLLQHPSNDLHALADTTGKAKDAAQHANLKKQVGDWRKFLHDATHIKATLETAKKDFGDLVAAGKWLHDALHGKTA